MYHQIPTRVFDPGLRLVLVLGLGLLALVGCSEDGPLSVAGQVAGEAANDSANEAFLEDAFANAADKSVDILNQDGSFVPGELVTVESLGKSLTFYPYTTTQLDEKPTAPVNLVFVGEADPVQIRSALLSLDGDRTAFGFPAAYPFDQIWTDALGGSVEATWVDGEGWIGSVIQLTIGNYETLRIHLRLYRTGQEGWTLGNVEFEVMIPGTADHQVLHWEMGEQIVIADLVRSGLLDPNAPIMSTGVINEVGGFGEIPSEIYNLLPEDLTTLIGTPTPVDGPVPIPSDGEGTILNLAQAAPLVSGEFTNTITLDYDQFVPRPFCSAGPYDYLYVTGPVQFDVWVSVDKNGNYRYRGSYDGTLHAVPVDIMTGQPIGEPFFAEVGDRQHGAINDRGAYVAARVERLTRESDGTQKLFDDLNIREGGLKKYRMFTRCFDAEELMAF